MPLNIAAACTQLMLHQLFLGTIGRGIKETIKEVDRILGANAFHTTITTNIQKTMLSESVKQFIVYYLFMNISGAIDKR